MFRRTKSSGDDTKTDLSVVPLHPKRKPQIASLCDRLNDVIDDYVTEEDSRGRIVTNAEIVGTIEFLKKRYMK